jgi:acetyl esterase/lipase
MPEMMDSLREIKDVPYCSTDLRIDPLRTLDLYIPEALFDLPDDSQSKQNIVLVVFVHGGAWRTGDKSDHAGLARRWASLGLPSSTSPSEKGADVTSVVVAVPNYRLSPIVKHPAHTDDIHTALQLLLIPSRSSHFLGTEGEDPTPSFEYSSVWIAGHSAGAHIAASLVLDAPNFTSSPSPSPGSERDPSMLSRITGVIGIEGIYDVDLLLKNFPSDFYRSFIEQAFGNRSIPYSERESEENRLPYEDVNAAKYDLPPSRTADKLHWVIVHSREDDLVDLVQAENMGAHLRRLYGGKEDFEANKPRSRVVL